MTGDDAGTSGRDRRKARLAATLRENLKRRKAQQRARADSGADSRPPTGEPPVAGADEGKG